MNICDYSKGAKYSSVTTNLMLVLRIPSRAFLMTAVSESGDGNWLLPGHRFCRRSASCWAALSQTKSNNLLEIPTYEWNSCGLEQESTSFLLVPPFHHADETVPHPCFSKLCPQWPPIPDFHTPVHAGDTFQRHASVSLSLKYLAPCLADDKAS